MNQSAVKSDQPSQQILLGIVAVLVGVSSLTGMDAIFAHLIDRGYPVFMLQGTRNWLCLGALWLVLMVRFGARTNPLAKRPWFLLLRGVLSYATAILFFLGLKSLDLGTVTTLLFFYPAIAAVLAAMLLGEQLGIWRILAVVLGLAGVIVALQPGGDLFQWASLLPLGAAVGFAVIQVMVRFVPSEVSSLAITTSGFAGMAIVGTPFLIATWQGFETTADLLWLLAATVLIVIGSQALTVAFRVAPIALVGSLDYSAILFAVFYGWLFFGDLPGWNLWLAIPMITIAGVVIAIAEARNAGRKPTKKTVEV